MLSPSTQQKFCFQIQKTNNAIWIRSNQSLRSENNGKSLSHTSYQKQFFDLQKITIDGIGTLQQDGSFKLNSKISSSSLSAEDIKKGITFVLQNGKISWHPEIIPFEELENPKEDEDLESEYENTPTEIISDVSTYPEHPTQVPDYEPTTETQPEVEHSYFSSLSDNKATVVCTAIAAAVTAIVAHILSGRRYLSKADTWSNWQPNNLNSIGLRSLPEDLLLKQLYHEIAYRYGNCSDQIKAFLEEIEQEIHELNLCYWSYSILRGLYLLPKIQRFEEIEDRINLLKMLADTVQQDLANKSIKNLLS